ncbi:MAG: serine/threonine protein kinase [Chloroflexi bacterium]|nr:serine/threonine protein kinase [Chloroflexota bacterium]
MELQLPKVFNDRYQLIKRIGEGGLAEVYQAQDMALGRLVAVKVLRPQYTRDPNFLVNFHREAQSAARLSDPHIVAVYDFGQDKNRPYIVMEWVAGSDLRTILDEQGALPIDQVVEYGIQICAAVGTAHRAGLVHGVAPEQASGDLVLPATDVYAVGIILYEMLTGRVPFVGVDDQDVARKQIYEAHIPVDQINPRIPEPLARIVDAAMAKNINERFLTADHLREALILFQQGGLNVSGVSGPISAVVGSPVQKVMPAAVPPPPPPPPARSYIPAAKATARPKRGGFDTLMFVLGLIAILAIIGLIPLVVAVYAAYFREPAGNSDLPPLAPGQIRMPYIVGLEENAARSALQNMGLELVVEGEEPHPELPAFKIISQSIEAGEKYEDWSTETPGNVISQDPPAESLVANRTLVTLFVSSGSRVPVGANLGGQIVLNAYEIPRIQYKPGEIVNLTFFWQAVTLPTANYEIFIHLTTPQGGIVSQIDTQPQDGVRPTSNWSVGDLIVDPYQLPIPSTTAPGDYQIRIGFNNVDSKARLPIFEPGRGQQDNLGALILRTIQVVP